MKILNRLFPILAALFVIAFVFTAPAFAQSQPPSTAATTASSPAPSPGIAGDLITYLTPLIALGVTWALNKVMPKIPNFLVPIIASGLGLLTNFINAYATGHSVNWVVALGLGLAATGVHQIQAQLKAPAVPPTA